VTPNAYSARMELKVVIIYFSIAVLTPGFGGHVCNGALI